MDKAIHLRDSFFITTSQDISKLKNRRVTGFMDFMSEVECQRYVAGIPEAYVDYYNKGRTVTTAKASMMSAIRASANDPKAELKRVRFTIFTSDK